MGLFSKLLGTDKAVDNILDKDNGLLKRFGGWVDDFNYTPEEMAQSNKEKRDWGIKQLEALAPFKVVQRMLAFAAALLWIAVGVSVLVALWIEPFYNVEETVVINGIVTVKSANINLVEPMLKFALSDYVFWPVTLVFALYFSGGVIESFTRGKKP